MGKEDIELAEEHVELAKDIVLDEAKKSDDPEKAKEFKEAGFALEKAGSEIKDLDEE
jgi:hypothetical protein